MVLYWQESKDKTEIKEKYYKRKSLRYLYGGEAIWFWIWLSRS